MRARNVLILIAVLVSLVLVPAAQVSAQVPETFCPSPKYASATVDGNPAEWVGVPVFANLYRAGDPCKPVEAYLRLVYDCHTGTMYVLVLSKDGMAVQQNVGEAWVKVDFSPSPVTFTAFAWVLNASGVTIGWEASFPLSEGTHFLKAHANVNDGGWQTAATGWICVDIDCPPTAVTIAGFTVTPDKGGILVSWETASEINNLGFEIRRNTVKNYGKSTKVKFVPSKSPGGMIGAQYRWTNRFDSANNPVLAGVRYYYWLVAIDTSGQRDVYYVGYARWVPK